VVVAIDGKWTGDRWEVYINGGRVPAELEVVSWAREAERLGAGEILLTSMDTDGTQAGFDLAMLAAVSDAVSIPVIASGGAGNLEHFYDALTRGVRCPWARSSSTWLSAAYRFALNEGCPEGRPEINDAVGKH
jgi:cyclase